MGSSSERPLDHRHEHPVRAPGYLFRADRRHLIAAVGVFTVNITKGVDTVLGERGARLSGGIPSALRV